MRYSLHKENRVKRLFIFLAFTLFSINTFAYSIINDTKFKEVLPDFKDAFITEWPAMAVLRPQYFAAQSEKESCAGKTKCWNPKVEFKTSREYGFGIPQITITSTFNNFENLKKANSKLKNWEYSDRYNAYYQFIAMFTLNKTCWNQTKWAGAYDDHYAMMFSCYNGGYGGILKDRAICAKTKGCNKDLWFGHIEKYSTKSKTPVNGYGKSFYQINREYPREIMYTRYQKYVPYVADLKAGTYKLSKQR